MVSNVKVIRADKKTRDFMKWVSEIIKVEADEVLKIKDFTIVNDCFQYKSNLPAGLPAGGRQACEEISVFWRALIRFILAGFIFLGFVLNADAQSAEKQQVDSLWWKQKTEQLGYAEEQLPTGDFQFNPRALPTWFQSSIFKYSILFLITAILLFVLYKLFGKNIFIGDLEDERTATHLLSENDLDDRFYEMDLELLLNKAVSGQNWAMAIRIRFLMVIKKLIDQNQISWHKDLTNRQIAWQIRPIESRNDFFDLVGYFEKVWYGDIQVTSEYYQKISPRFEEYKGTIYPNDKK